MLALGLLPGAPAVLAVAPVAVMLADGGAPAVLALHPDGERRCLRPCSPRTCSSAGHAGTFSAPASGLVLLPLPPSPPTTATLHAWRRFPNAPALSRARHRRRACRPGHGRGATRRARGAAGVRRDASASEVPTATITVNQQKHSWQLQRQSGLRRRGSCAGKRGSCKRKQPPCGGRILVGMGKHGASAAHAFAHALAMGIQTKFGVACDPKEIVVRVEALCPGWAGHDAEAIVHEWNAKHLEDGASIEDVKHSRRYAVRVEARRVEEFATAYFAMRTAEFLKMPMTCAIRTGAQGDGSGAVALVACMPGGQELQAVNIWSADKVHLSVNAENLSYAMTFDPTITRVSPAGDGMQASQIDEFYKRRKEQLPTKAAKWLADMGAGIASSSLQVTFDPSEAGGILNRMSALDISYAARVLDLMDARTAAEIINKMEYDKICHAAEMLYEMEDIKAAQVLIEMDSISIMGSSKAAAVLANFDISYAAKVLDLIDVSKAAGMLKNMIRTDAHPYGYSYGSPSDPADAEKVAEILEKMVTAAAVLCEIGFRYHHAAAQVFATMNAATVAQVVCAMCEIDDHAAPQVLETMDPSDAALVLQDLDASAAAAILLHFDVGNGAALLDQMDPSHAALLLQELDACDSAEMLEHLSTVDTSAAAEVLGGVDTSYAAEVLELINVRTAAGMLESLLSTMQVGRAAGILDEMDASAVSEVLQYLDASESVRVLGEMDGSKVARMLGAFDLLDSAQVLDQMESSAAAGVLDVFDVGYAAEVLDRMETSKAGETLELMNTRAGLLDEMHVEKVAGVLTHIHASKAAEWLEEMCPSAVSLVLEHMNSRDIARVLK